MTRVLVLIKLNDGVDPAAYEAWAREHDLPAIRALGAVERFDIVRVTNDEGDPPYDYVEIADVADPAAFGEQVSSEETQRQIADFGKYCSAPVLLAGHEL